ncbi:MAG: hypothetical protein MJK04_10095 [Psychrosphaera sp.]|nr:hypothetical protein [Psychrosphaera sp.]
MVLNKLVQSALLILAIACPCANGWIVAPGDFKSKPKNNQTLTDKGNIDQSQNATGAVDSAESGSIEMDGELVSDSDLKNTSTENHSEVIQLNGKKAEAVSLNKNINETIQQTRQQPELAFNKSTGRGSQATGDMNRQKMPAVKYQVGGSGNVNASINNSNHKSNRNSVADYNRNASDEVENYLIDTDSEVLTRTHLAAVEDQAFDSIFTEQEVNEQEVDEQTEQQALDQALIEAQINDVLSSAEFLAIERSVESDKAGDKSTKPILLDKSQLSSAPEELLNQLDASDLMDYVAEDDLWKEQLTIEDEP